MIVLPTVGMPYVITVAAPSDFHARWPQSRFRVAFARKVSARWVFDLKSPIKHNGRRYTRIEAVPQQPMNEIDPYCAENTIVCRMIDPDERASEWIIANLAPDIEREQPLPLLPPLSQWLSTFTNAA